MGNTSSSSIALPVESYQHSRRRSMLSQLINCSSIADEQLDEVAPLHDSKRFYDAQPQAIPALSYSPLPPYSYHGGTPDPVSEAYAKFLQDYPEYSLTGIIDALRNREYTRLEHSGETYVDYTGGGMYPQTLTKEHLDFLNTNVLGNTHSVNNSSTLSMKCAEEARQAALTFFGASEDTYTVVFTPNATGALKLVGESFPFTTGSSYVLSADSHNSVNGVREFAMHKNADVVYIPTTPVGGTNVKTAKDLLMQHKPQDKTRNPSLLILTAQSNATNSKNDLTLIKYAASLGFHTMVDAAALAPCSPIRLSDIDADAMCISFYKMFGYPTGLGALVVKKTFLMDVLQRPWFGGGTVNLVQAPGKIVTLTPVPHERFEDGTINYASTKAITDGLKFLAVYQPYLSLRISCLIHYLWATIPTIVHDSTKAPVAQIVSRYPGPRLTKVGEHSETGTIIALLFNDPHGKLLPISFIEFAAAQNKISLRTGCVCNPGGVSAMIGIKEEMKKLHDGMTKKEWEQQLGREIGIVRVSFGLANNFEDAWRVAQFVSLIGQTPARKELWEKWQGSRRPERC